MLEKPVVTSFSRATEPTRTSPIQFGCSCSKLGASCNWLPILGSKNQTELDLKTLYILCYRYCTVFDHATGML